MELRQLRYFLEAASCANFSRAAKRLRVAQPALGRQVQKLEDEIGASLFLRVGRGVVLTEAGVLLAKHAAFILKQVDHARESVAAEGTVPRGTVSIGAPPSVAHYFFPPLIKAYRDAYPNVTIRLLEGMTYNLISWLKEDLVDLAIVSQTAGTEFSLDQELVHTAVAVEGMYVFGGRGGKRLPAMVEVVDLAGLPLILTGRSTLSRLGLEKAADRTGVELSVVIEIESQLIMKDLVRRGMGFGIVPVSSLHGELEDFEVGLLRGVSMTRMLTRRADKPLTPAMNELTRIAASTIEDLRKSGRFQ